eukprot:CAMPEP_0174301526 /NCGR_PEP_ID=MMETSP0809-20121228/59098_1 /TAXON_ID=73025 ORGANISM="Eutreptiella gymnastica-like, Strain CCMP1594" /NCGR_SAMPLE_ID=MMETSP0809 /ASSEMBLY_ACC=CAM_ASM_000658 /LENGTH=253 /DNA_ID=CAMNT_0015407287 /DNA_START=103 /DNA_END=864 /DNA_ORIENTATION=-
MDRPEHDPLKPRTPRKYTEGALREIGDSLPPEAPLPSGLQDSPVFTDPVALHPDAYEWMSSSFGKPRIIPWSTLSQLTLAGTQPQAAPDATEPAKPPPTIFCDLDGTLSDFEKKVKEITGSLPDGQPKDDMWRAIETYDGGGGDGFYAQLDWMEDGKQLWNAIKPLQPKILSGVPLGEWAAEQKRRWVARELGWHVKVLTCLAADKHLHCREGAVLIDDSVKLRGDWEAAGGVFVHHQSTKATLKQLKQLGIL